MKTLCISKRGDDYLLSSDDELIEDDYNDDEVMYPESNQNDSSLLLSMGV